MSPTPAGDAAKILTGLSDDEAALKAKKPKKISRKFEYDMGLFLRGTFKDRLCAINARNTGVHASWRQSGRYFWVTYTGTKKNVDRIIAWMNNWVRYPHRYP